MSYLMLYNFNHPHLAKLSLLGLIASFYDLVLLEATKFDIDRSSLFIRSFFVELKHWTSLRIKDNCLRGRYHHSDLGALVVRYQTITILNQICLARNLTV